MEFKINMINMLKTPMEKVDNRQDRINNATIQMEKLRKN